MPRMRTATHPIAIKAMTIGGRVIGFWTSREKKKLGVLFLFCKEIYVKNASTFDVRIDEWEVLGPIIYHIEDRFFFI